MSLSLTGPEIKFLSWVQNRKRFVVRSGDAQTALKISKQQEAKIYSSLTQRGMIAQIKRGLYLVPPTIPPGGKWAPSAFLILDVAMSDIGATQYQITGMSAFNLYGLTEQIPNRIDVYNDKIWGEKNLAGLEFRFIKTDRSRLGYTRNITTDDQGVLGGREVLAPYSDLSRALFDAVYDYERFGTLPNAYQWIKVRLGEKKVITEFVEICLKLGNISVLRRVGCLLERMKYSSRVIAQFKQKLKKTTSYIPLDPTRPNRGKTYKDWGVIDNESTSS